MTYNDYPIEECLATLARLTGRADFHQKFTCDHCGSRQTMATPNVMYKTGKCEACGNITDIAKRGCNYLLKIGFPPQ